MKKESGEQLISLAGISKSFKEPLANPFRPRNSKQALTGVNLTIPEGKVTCLLGPNGAGKTTLIKILSCLITADTGTICYRDKPIDGNGKGIYANIGLVTPNERSFYWRLTGRENLRFFGGLYGLSGRALRDRADEALTEAGLGEEADKAYRLYSAGMKQKLNIARALIGSPELFLLDEPAAHLDPLAREDFWRFIDGVLIKKRGATVFLCTHDLEEARRLADRVIVLDSGKVVAMGTPAELRSLIGERKELVLRYSGSLPTEWLAGWGENARREGADTLKLSFDEGNKPQEEVIREFIAAGGSLREAYSAQDDLLLLLRATAGSR